MGRTNLIVAGLLLLFTLRISAQSNFEFVENKGQWEEQIRYKGELSNGAFFLQKKGFTVLLHHPADWQRVMGLEHTSAVGASTNKGARDESKVVTQDLHRVRSHSYRVEFVGANENPQIVPDKPLSFYTNYFIGSDSSKWVSNARVFQALVYKNIYPNIDVRYYSENGKLKYDLIVHPGGDVSKIELRYVGADKLSIKNKDLIVKTSVGEVKELYPYSFQFDKLKGRTEVECSYQLSGNTVRFSVPNYSKDATLVIDPILIFSSFTGSSANQYGFTATPAPDGSFYSGGAVSGQGFPVTPGAFETTYQGGRGTPGWDIGIMKFNATGTQRLYATYLGGNQNDYPHSLFSDPQGNLVVLGRTYSGPDYPGTFEGTNGANSGADIIVTKLTSNGNALIGSLRIGGSGMDGVNIEDQQESTRHDDISLLRNYGDDSRSEVILDGNNNIYVASQTFSDNFPTRGTGFDKIYGGGQDGVVLKINPACTGIIWSTYLGGAANDGAFVLALNPADGTLYVAGATAGNDMPGNTSGTIQPGSAGNIDGYVTILPNDGSAALRTTYLGTSAIDIVYGIQFDRRGFPYVMGTTRGAWRVTNNVGFINPNSKQFVAKLQPDLSAFIFSTVFGNGSAQPNISPVAFLVDRCENMYISGWGGNNPNQGVNQNYDVASLGGMPITTDAIKSITDDKDFYFIVIQKNASALLYGSFFGQDGGYGEHVDGGTSRYDQQGVIYQAMCANCVDTNVPFPTTPGVVGPINRAGSGACNLAAVKIAFNFAGVASGPKAFFNGAPDSSGCVPFTVTLRDTIRNAKSYEWSFGDGTPDLVTTNFETNHTYTAVGDYRVRLIAIDSNTCNVRDTAYINIRVRDDQALIDFAATKLPPCQSLSYRFDNLSVAPPGKPFSGTSFTWSFGDGTRVTAGAGPVNHNFAAAGTYKVRLILTDTNYCNAPDSVEKELRIAPLVDAQFQTPPGGCAPYNAQFNNTSLAGQQFFWDFGDGTTSRAVNPTHLYQNIGTYTIRLIAIDSATCNIIDSTQQTITVSSRPTADFSHAPIPAQENKPTIFTNLSVGGVRYKWFFGDGDSTIKTTMDTTLHQYNATGTYQACLITYNQFGCTDTICKPVDARILPLLDVPNAFTPGKFGRNSIVRVEGFGIRRMNWIIYNRWGQKVFESNDRKIGWNGTFKGQLQPMDVYAYTLDVEFSDGTKTRKTGDITLIR